MHDAASVGMCQCEEDSVDDPRAFAHRRTPSLFDALGQALSLLVRNDDKWTGHALLHQVAEVEHRRDMGMVGQARREFHSGEKAMAKARIHCARGVENLEPDGASKGKMLRGVACDSVAAFEHRMDTKATVDDGAGFNR